MYLKSNLIQFLKTDESILDFIEEYALDGLWFWNAEDSNRSWVNTKLKSVLGYQQKDNDVALNQQFIHFFKQDFFLNTIDYSVEKGGYFHQFTYFHENGNKLVMDCKMLNVFDEKKKMLGVLGANTFACQVDIDANKVVLDLDFFNQLKKNEEILKESSQMARVGSWEMNLNTGALYWSKVTCEIHEVPDNFQPCLADGINFYKEGISRDTITKAVEDCIALEKTFDVELQLITAKGNEIWVRAIGKADFSASNDKRIFGVFQDINQIKKIAVEHTQTTELLAKLATQVPGTLFQFQLFDTGESYFPYTSRNFINSNNYYEMTPQQRSAYYFQHIHSEDLPIIMQKVQQSAKTLTTLSFQYRYHDENRGTLWIALVANPERLVNSVLWHGYSIEITESKKVEDELKDTKRLLQESNKLAMIGAWESNLNTGESNWSDFTREIFGINEAFQPSIETINTFFKEGESRDAISRALNSCINDGQPFNLELEMTNNFGDDIWVRIIGYADFSESNNKRIFGSIQDISYIKEIEIVKEASNILLTKLTKQLPGVLYQFEVNRNGGSSIIYHSNDFFEIKGFNKMSSAEKANAFWKIIHPEDFQEMTGLIMQAVKSFSKFEHEYRVCLPDGTIKWVHSIAKPERVKNGVLFHGYLFDITQQKEIELAFQRTRNLLEESSRVAKLGGWSFDLKTKVIHWSNLIKEILGTPADFNPSLESGIIFYKEGHYRDSVRIALKNCLEEGIPFDIESKIINTAGKEIWIRVAGKAEKTKGEVNRIYGIFQDIEHLKVAEAHKEKLQKLELLLAKEKELNAIKSRYLTLTSHEFRTPLAAILGSTELIEMTSDFIENKSVSEKIHKHIEIIKLQIDRLSFMIKDVLSLENTGADTTRLTTQSFSIKTFVSDLRQSLSSNQTLELFLPDDDKEIISDKTLLDVILNNLLNNAFKYSRLSNQNPELQLTYLDKSIEIAIKDYGIGIPAKEQDQVFEAFFRASNSIRTEGTGFGLSVAKELTERLGGNITFHSVEGEGSTFLLNIPYFI